MVLKVEPLEAEEAVHGGENYPVAFRSQTRGSEYIGVIGSRPTLIINTED